MPLAPADYAVIGFVSDVDLLRSILRPGQRRVERNASEYNPSSDTHYSLRTHGAMSCASLARERLEFAIAAVHDSFFMSRARTIIAITTTWLEHRVGSVLAFHDVGIIKIVLKSREFS